MDKILEERNWAVGRGDVRALLRFGESAAGNEEAQATEEELADHRRRATTALRKAAREGDSTLVGQLVKEGADVNGEGLDGVTAAWYAAANENIGVLQSLTMGKAFGSAYADLDAAARDGTTPMMAAARNGNDGAVRFLLCEEADWRRQTKAHKTALDIAKEFNRSRVQHLLEAVQLCDAATVGGSKGTLEVARLLASTEERGDGANMRPDGCCEACRGGCSNSGLNTEDACRSGLDHCYRSAMHRCASLALSPLPLIIFSYKSEKSLCGTGQPRRIRWGRWRCYLRTVRTSTSRERGSPTRLAVRSERTHRSWPRPMLVPLRPWAFCSSSTRIGGSLTATGKRRSRWRLRTSTRRLWRPLRPSRMTSEPRTFPHRAIIHLWSSHARAQAHAHTHTHAHIIHTLFLERPARPTDCAAVRCAGRRNCHRSIRKLTRRIDDLEMNPASDRTEMQGLKDQRERLKQEQKAADDARVARRRGGRGA